MLDVPPMMIMTILDISSLKLAQCGASSGGERLCPGICRVVGGTGHPRTTSSLPQFLSLSGPYSRDEEG